MEKPSLTLEKLQDRIISMEEERWAVANALDVALKINDIRPDAAATDTRCPLALEANALAVVPRSLVLAEFAANHFVAGAVVAAHIDLAHIGAA